MPRYDFLCTDCESTFEHQLPVGEPPPKCLDCGSANVERQIAPPSVIFKGAGFYKTDSSTAKTVKSDKPVEKPVKGATANTKENKANEASKNSNNKPKNTT